MVAAEPIDLAPPPEAALAVLDRLQAAGHEAYCVGGCVRDRLIGRGVGDWDLTTDALPEQVVGLFEHVVPTGLAHGTVTVVSGGLNVEVTTYRVDLGYTDGRRPDGVAFTRSLAEDLARRDFTMNAMAWDPRRGLLVDLFDGRADLASGAVRAVGEPEARFREDGLRALRAVRFASVLGLDIEPATWDAIGRTLEVFARVSAERIQVELVKTLMSPRPGWGALRLAESGLLGVFLPAWPTSCMPAVAASLGRSPPDLAIRLAVFLSPLVDGAEAALDTLRFSNVLRTSVLGMLRTFVLRPDHAGSPAEVRALAAVIGRVGLDAALGLHAALQTPTWVGFDARLEAASARACPLVPKELALTGHEVMAALNLPPSRIVGRLMEALLRRVWLDPALNTRAGLLSVLPSVIAEVTDTGGAP
jgi:tRNA nucleotidyltransferase (CCA-adding enzyme)